MPQDPADPLLPAPQNILSLRQKATNFTQSFRDYYIFAVIAIAWWAWYTPEGFHNSQAYIPAIAGGPGWNGQDGLHTIFNKDSTWVDWMIHVVIEQAATFFPFYFVTDDAAHYPGGMQRVVWTCDDTLGAMHGWREKHPEFLSMSDFGFALGMLNTAVKNLSKLREMVNNISSDDPDRDKKIKMLTTLISDLTTMCGAICAGLSMIILPRLFVLFSPILYTVSGLMTIATKSETVRRYVIDTGFEYAKKLCSKLRASHNTADPSTSINGDSAYQQV